MKEKLKNKKVVYTIIGIVSVLLVALAVTYAYWLVTKTQDKENEISSACLDIAISGEKNDIELTNQFPMSDEDGMKLVPYEFTVTNNCNTSVDYQVALEATGDESNTISSSALKVALDDAVTLLSDNEVVDATISGAYESRKLGVGTLASVGSEGSSVTYTLRIWIDADAPISEMNKTFKSRISVTIGQGIFNPYKEGTLAYSILATASATGTISEINEDEIKENVRIDSAYISTTYYYGTEYTFNAETKKYTLSGNIVQSTLQGCRNGDVECGKYTLKQQSASATSHTLYEIIDWYHPESNYYISSKIIKYTTPFEWPETKSTLNKTRDDLGDSYYFRGNVNNNYVQFGTWLKIENGWVIGGWSAGENDIYWDSTAIFNSIEECEASSYDVCNDMLSVNIGDPMYWRIVRINGDGTIRIIYDGTQTYNNDEQHNTSIGPSMFYSNGTGNFNDNKIVGYTYDDGTGTQIDSNLKKAADTWFSNNFEGKYDQYIADGIFCNDRTIAISNSQKNLYAAAERLENKKHPTLKCTNQADRYTVNDLKNGNGLLTYPVGLITADEVTFAGAAYGMQNNTYYLYGGSKNLLLTMTPYAEYIYSTNNQLHMFSMRADGMLSADWNGSIRPVINLKADVKFTGDGTIDNPYKIVTE